LTAHGLLLKADR